MRMNLGQFYAAATVQQTFAALRHPNYRLWFMGQLVSVAGSWMQTTAQGFLIYELTKSPAFLGYVGFAAGVPSWVFMLYGGVIADRISRRTIILVAQVAMMVLAFVLAGLVATGLVQPWMVVILALLNGVANAFDAPSRQAFVVELVDREDMTNAIALNSTMFNAAAVVGPALAGVIYALLGPAWCFTLNGLSFVAVIVALLAMKLAPVVRTSRVGSTGDQLRQGLRYVVGDRVTLTLILNMGVISLFGISMVNLFPAWSVNVLGGDVRTNGLMLATRGLGALSGALLIAALGKRTARGRFWTIGSFVMPLAMVGFAFARSIPLALILLVGLGWGFMVVANSSNAMVQTRVPDELRGRIMSIYTLIFFGGMPLGALVAGLMADRIGAPTTVLINACVVLLVSALIWLRLPYIRQLR
ncbi:MAG: MFS transporter [Anaerolineae bacterium]